MEECWLIEKCNYVEAVKDAEDMFIQDQESLWTQRGVYDGECE